MRSMLQEKTYSPISSSSETTQTIQKKTSQGYSWLGIHSESGIRDSSRHGSIMEANCICSFQVAPAQTVTRHGNGNGSTNLGPGILVAQDVKLSSDVSFFHFSISLCKQRRHYCLLILCNDVIMGNPISDSKRTCNLYLFLCLQFSTGKGFHRIQQIVHSKKGTGGSTATGAPRERAILCQHGHC